MCPATASNRNFKLIIEYDGSNYCGWQRQKNDPSVQGAIEKALERLLGGPVTLIGSGRTDAGVHALGQVANFQAVTRLEAPIIQKALNALLERDIVIRSCVPAAPSFHARYDALAKTYHYHVLNRTLPSAIGRQYCWWLSRPLNWEAIRSGARCLVGTHDFTAFEAAGSPRAHAVRTISCLHIEESEPGTFVFRITANGFLRYMVRNIVGTLVEVGGGKIAPRDVALILDAKKRSLAGATAPPQGLFLMDVRYPADVAVYADASAAVSSLNR